MTRRIRKRNRLVLFSAEGRNVTETLYLKDLIKDKEGFTLRKAYGNATDPVGMLKDIIATMKDLDFEPSYGDIALCFIDFDCNRGKELQIREAATLARKKRINLIISNPCFELWFICHFTATPKNYTGSKQLLDDMNRYICGYSKAKEGIYSLLKDKTGHAVKTAANLEKTALSKGYKYLSADFAPATDMFRLFSLMDTAAGKTD